MTAAPERTPFCIIGKLKHVLLMYNNMLYIRVNINRKQEENEI